MSFAAHAVFTSAFLVVVFKVRKVNVAAAGSATKAAVPVDTFGILTTVVVVTGIMLRVCYMLFTSAGTRTYDVYRESWGHLDYIMHIAEYLSLPPVNDCQAYHPPLHHIISAAALSTGRLVTRDQFLQIKCIQALMALLNSLTLICFGKIMKEMGCSGAAVLAGVSVFAFHPANIYFASRINNDNTLMFFYTLTFFFLIRWLNNSTTGNLLLMTLFSSMAALTKLSGIMLLPLAGAAFAAAALRNRNRLKLYAKQFALFCFLYFPLSFSYQIRNFVLFGQDFGYVPSYGQGFTPTFYNLICLPVSGFLASPFNNGGIDGGEFFLEYLIKSSLFGEWKYPGLEKPALVLIILAFLIFIIPAVYVFRHKAAILGSNERIFLLNLAVPLALAAKFRTDLPVACSQDFRYVAPILITLAYFTGKAAGEAYGLKKRTAAIFIAGIIGGFCMLSSIFVILLGNFE